MPIRFRCASCNQLLGVSSRKARATVRCPKCSNEVGVPVWTAANADHKSSRNAGRDSKCDPISVDKLILDMHVPLFFFSQRFKSLLTLDNYGPDEGDVFPVKIGLEGPHFSRLISSVIQPEE